METSDAIQSTHRTPTCRPRSANGNRHRARCQHLIPFRRFCRYVHDLFTSPTSNIYRPHDGRFAQYENQTRSLLYPSRQRRSPFGWRLESAILDTSPSISLFPFCDSFTNSSPPPQKSLPNLYASPSIPITSRSPSAPSLIRAIARDRMLIESDTHDATLNTRYLWAATEWVGRLKGWKIEGLHHNHNQHQEEDEDWELESEEEEEVYDHRGKPIDPAPHEIWTVRTLERNWARFMRLLD